VIRLLLSLLVKQFLGDRL